MSNTITHNVQPDLKAIVARYKTNGEIGTPKQSLDTFEGETTAYLANEQIEEFKRNLAPLDNGPLDQDPRLNHVEASSGDDKASYHVDGDVTTIYIDGPGWVGFAQTGPGLLQFVEAKSEGNTVTAQAVTQGPNGSFFQELEYTAKGGFTPPN